MGTAYKINYSRAFVLRAGDSFKKPWVFRFSLPAKVWSPFATLVLLSQQPCRAVDSLLSSIMASRGVLFDHMCVTTAVFWLYWQGRMPCSKICRSKCLKLLQLKGTQKQEVPPPLSAMSLIAEFKFEYLNPVLYCRWTTPTSQHFIVTKIAYLCTTACCYFQVVTLLSDHLMLPLLRRVFVTLEQAEVTVLSSTE